MLPLRFSISPSFHLSTVLAPPFRCLNCSVAMELVLCMDSIFDIFPEHGFASTCMKIYDEIAPK